MNKGIHKINLRDIKIRETKNELLSNNGEYIRRHYNKQVHLPESSSNQQMNCQHPIKGFPIQNIPEANMRYSVTKPQTKSELYHIEYTGYCEESSSQLKKRSSTKIRKKSKRRSQTVDRVHESAEIVNKIKLDEEIEDYSSLKLKIYNDKEEPKQKFIVEEKSRSQSVCDAQSSVTSK